MENIQGKTAFITGGASGIGLGMAKAFSAHGMKIIMADIRQNALNEAMDFFRKSDRPAHTIELDVTDREAYVRAADKAESVFGNIHVLANNAGVGLGGCPLYENSYKDWDFIIGVNIMGVVNGIHTIVPRILKHGEGGHVLATSSSCGLFAVGGFGLYNTTKFAVAGLMETLASDLKDTGVGASVYFPGPINSNLPVTSHECRPTHLKNEQEPTPRPRRREGVPPFDPKEIFMDPLEASERILRGIRHNDMFIMTHPEFKDGIIARNEALLRAVPDEPPNAKRYEVIKHFGTLLYNPIYETQNQVGPYKPE